MKKEEFLAFSFPYGLKMQSNINKNEIFNIYGIELNEGLFHADEDEYSWYCIDMFKPILHPLSDLTKEIEHNGEKFVPIVELNDIFLREWCDLFDESIYAINEFCNHNDYSKILFLPCLIINKLIEWKFDVAELIEKNEAIDVNTLEVNPYK